MRELEQEELKGKRGGGGSSSASQVCVYVCVCADTHDLNILSYLHEAARALIMFVCVCVSACV
jgi:hypothetical protein